MNPVIEKLKSIRVKNLLDVATGKGDFLKMMTDHLAGYQNALGIDVDETSLNLAREKFDGEIRVEFRCVHGQQLPFPENHFDLVSISNALHHLDDVQAVLAEMKRVCRPDGWMLIAEMYRETQSSAQENFHEFHDLICEMRRHLGHDFSGTFSRLRLKEMFDELNLSSFELIDYTEANPPPISPEDAQGRLAGLQQILDRLHAHPEYETYRRRLERFRRNFEQDGLNLPSQLILLGRK
jgi:2-polyprenyl-3-methyl-5-hydroxy-6-metoxy-1,4-benzoquinol methylase